MVSGSIHTHLAVPIARQSGTHFLYGEAHEAWSEDHRDTLFAVVSAVDCRGAAPR